MNKAKGNILQVVITDGSDYLHVTFFAKNPKVFYHHQKILKVGENILFSGVVSGYNGVKQLVHPEFESLEEVNKNIDFNTSIGNSISFDGEFSLEADDFNDSLKEYVNKPIPIYPGTNGFASWKVKSCIQTVLNMIDEQSFCEVIPKIKLSENKLTYYEAIQKLHNPKVEQDYKKAKKTLKYYEAFMLNMALLMRKKGYQKQDSYKCDGGITNFYEKVLNVLPFKLTNAQKKVLNEILTDISINHPMQRMVLGDVGSGKTIVALLAMLKVVDSGYKAVLLAPTEVLATQHYESICNLLGSDLKTILDLPSARKVDVNLFTGAISNAEKKQILAKMVTKGAGIYIGTHALLSKHVQISELGLLVVDEQHRFGVDQRQKLLDTDGEVPHLLSMSATPIPRSLAVTILGDSDLSIIDEKPSGRKQVQTFLINPNNTYVKNGIKRTWEERLWEKAGEEIAKGNSVYVVVPKIDSNDKNVDSSGNTFTGSFMPDDKRYDKNSYLEYSNEALSHVADGVKLDSCCDNTSKAYNTRNSHNATKEIISIDKACQKITSSKFLNTVPLQILSSKVSQKEKEEIIQNFSNGKAPILVSTTVVEVGVDVKNATMIVIMDAHRFGLATLHQLRGRVGRNDKDSFCMLYVDLPANHPSYEKLLEFAKTNDGFKIAELDLSIRKEGDIFGIRQSGKKSALKFLNIISDIDIIHESLNDIKTDEQYYISCCENINFSKQLELFFNSDEVQYWFKN